jgi:hypothetical protein
VRRDADGGVRVGSSWGSITERLIRDAQERGDFDDLPFHGQPIELRDDEYAGDHALAWHVLRNAGVAPPWIEADKDCRRLLDARDRLLARARASPTGSRWALHRELRVIVEEHARRAEVRNGLAPAGAPPHRRLSLDREAEALDRALGIHPAQGQARGGESPRDARPGRDAD